MKVHTQLANLSPKINAHSKLYVMASADCKLKCPSSIALIGPLLVPFYNTLGPLLKWAQCSSVWLLVIFTPWFPY